MRYTIPATGRRERGETVDYDRDPMDENDEDEEHTCHACGIAGADRPGLYQVADRWFCTDHANMLDAMRIEQQTATPPPVVVVEILGGCFSYTCSTAPVRVCVVDWDVINEGDDEGAGPWVEDPAGIRALDPEARQLIDRDFPGLLPQVEEVPS